MAARRLLAAAQSKLGDPSAAVETLGPVLEQGAADDSGLSVLAGRAFLQAGSADKAIALLEAALEEDPNNIEIGLNLASAYLAVNRPSDAIQLARAIPESDDYQRELIMALGFAAMGQLESADEQIASVVSRDPENPSMLALAGDFYLRFEDFENALTYFKRSSNIDPNHLPSLQGLARAHLRMGDPIAAADILQRVLTLDEENVAAMISLADLRAASGDIDESIRLLEQAVALNSVSPLPRVMLARALVRSGDVIRGEQLAREAAKLASSDGLAQAETGGILLEIGKHAEALSFLNTAKTLSPDSAAVWYLLGQAQLALGESADARNSLNRSIELDSTSVTANSLLALLEMREGNLDKALEIARKAKQINPGSPAPRAVEADTLMQMARW